VHSVPIVRITPEFKEDLGASTASSSAPSTTPASAAAVAPMPAADKKSPQLQIKDVFKQMSYLYKTTRKLHNSHTKLSSSVDDMKKHTSDSFEDVKKQNATLLFQVKQSANKAQAVAKHAGTLSQACFCCVFPNGLSQNLKPGPRKYICNI